MADEALIAAAAAGLYYVLRGKKREPRDVRADLPEVTGPQPKAIAATREETLARQAPPPPLPPVVAAALAPPPPPAQTLAPTPIMPPPAPAPILMPPVAALPVVPSLPAPQRPEGMFQRKSFAPSHGRLMPMADADRIYPPVFPTFLK